MTNALTGVLFRELLARWFGPQFAYPHLAEAAVNAAILEETTNKNAAGSPASDRPR